MPKSARRYTPPRLEPVTVARAAQMLRHGVPTRQVMADLEIGEGSVYRIKRGTHPALGQIVHARCPGCGGLQRMPCRVCAARSKPQEAA